MENSSLRHLADSLYSFAISLNEVEIRLITKKDDDISKVELMYNEKYKFHKFVKFVEMKKAASDDSKDYYVIRLKLTDKRLAYVFKLTLLDGSIKYFSELGVSDHYDFSQGQFNFFQVSYINKNDLLKVNPILVNRRFYQIFVDRFNKEDNLNPRINIKWGDEITSSSIAGGTLKGIIDKLDYIKSLNIDALYLTPISDADTNHKYDTISYFKVASDFGSDLDLKLLVDEVHNRKMIILLDGVYNHVSTHFFAFEDVKRYGKKSKYYDWFYIDGDEVDMKKGNYESFGVAKFLPRLNLNNLEVQDYLIEAAKHYVINFNIDGYRLDVSDEIPHSFWIRLRNELKKIKKDIVLLGENWHDAHAFLNSGFEFDSIMNYAFTRDVLDYVAYEKIDAERFKNRLVNNYFRYKTPINYNLLNLLSSHDIPRFYSECKEDIDKLFIGYALLYTYIGVPCLYYGDEIGLTGLADPNNRKCFDWDERKWNFDILKMIKALAKIHEEQNINNLGISVLCDKNLFILKRFDEEKEIKLIINMSKDVSAYQIDDEEILLSHNYKEDKLLAKSFVLTLNKLK